jgi:hypothetical protein
VESLDTVLDLERADLLGNSHDGLSRKVAFLRADDGCRATFFEKSFSWCKFWVLAASNMARDQ